MLNKDKIALLAREIRKKKELRDISDDFVQEFLVKYLQQEQKTAKALQENFNPKSKAYGSVIKNARSQLRRVYGLFRDNPRERKKLVEELLASPKKTQIQTQTQTQNRTAIIQLILSTHSSTQERLPFYEKLYAKLFDITGRPKTILDVGCGINPFSFMHMKLERCAYYAYDINEKEIESINRYFELLHAENNFFLGKASVADITKINFPEADICFLFKMTDIIDKGKGHKKTEELLKRIPAKFVVISFATKTMSGKEMAAPRRNWVDWLCRRLRYEYTVLEFPNEIFYVIRKG